MRISPAARDALGLFRWIAAAALAVAVVLLLTIRASAAPRDEPQVGMDNGPRATAIIDEARRLFLAGQAGPASRMLEAAHARAPNPRYLANLGWIHEDLGLPGEALEYYERCLASDPDSATGESVQRRLPRLEKLAGAAYLRITLISEPPHAEVSVRAPYGTRHPGRTPLALWLPLGQVDVELSLPGYRPASIAGPVAVDGPGELHVDLRPASGFLLLDGVDEACEVRVDGRVTPVEALAGPLEASPGPHRVTVLKPEHEAFDAVVTVTPEATTVVAVTLLHRLPPPSPEPAVHHPPVAAEPGFEVPVASWALGGVSVASLIAGIATGVAASESAAEARRYSADGLNDPVRHERAREDSFVQGVVADVSFAVAGAAAITGIVLALVLPPDGDGDAVLPSSSTAAGAPSAGISFRF